MPFVILPRRRSCLACAEDRPGEETALGRTRSLPGIRRDYCPSFPHITFIDSISLFISSLESLGTR